MTQNRVGPLEVGQDLRFQRYQWSVQRWGWLTLLLLIVAALLGLLGSGPLSGAAAETSDGAVGVGYDRFLRRAAPATLSVTLRPGAGGETARLWLDAAYLRRVRLLRVTPQPEREEAGPGGHTFVFRLAEPGEVTEVSFHFEPEEVGPLPGRLALAGGPAVTFGQFVYP